MKPEDVAHAPLWRRSNSVKHIRGIFLEDGKDKAFFKTEKLDKQSGPKPSTSSQMVAKAGNAAIVKTNRRPYKPASPLKIKAESESSVREFVCPKCGVFKTKNMKSMQVHLYNELGYKR